MTIARFNPNEFVIYTKAYAIAVVHHMFMQLEHVISFASADNANLSLNNAEYPVKAQLNNSFYFSFPKTNQ